MLVRMLRPATDDDVMTMLSWRNQEQNRVVSLTQHVISEEEHLAWWSKTSADPSRRVLIFSVDGTDCGVASYFDINPESRSAAWGFFLDTEGPYGTDLRAWVDLMREGVAFAFDQLPIDVLTGEVLGDNPGVRAMNRRLGFKEGDSREIAVEGGTVTAHSLRLERADRR